MNKSKRFLFFLVSFTDLNRKTSLDSTSSSQFSDIDFSETFDDAANNNGNSNNSNRNCTNGTNLTINANDRTRHNSADEDCTEVIKKIRQQSKPVRITLKLHVTETTYSVWDTVLNPDNNILYVALPTVLLPEASKQSFITLLEFAEEKLEVDAVVLCMRKDRLDRPNLVRTFLFLGFQPLSPKSALAPPQKADENNLFLIYNIEED